MNTERINNCKNATISKETSQWITLMARFDDLVDDIIKSLNSMYGDTLGANHYEKSFEVVSVKMYNAFQEHLSECIALSLAEHNYKQI